MRSIPDNEKKGTNKKLNLKGIYYNELSKHAPNIVINKMEKENAPPQKHQGKYYHSAVRKVNHVRMHATVLMETWKKTTIII